MEKKAKQLAHEHDAMTDCYRILCCISQEGANSGDPYVAHVATIFVHRNAGL
jgi:hypothetical protein